EGQELVLRERVGERHLGDDLGAVASPVEPYVRAVLVAHLARAPLRAAPARVEGRVDVHEPREAVGQPGQDLEVVAEVDLDHLRGLYPRGEAAGLHLADALS